MGALLSCRLDVEVAADVAVADMPANPDDNTALARAIVHDLDVGSS
jgi:hypothetical protein